MAYKSQLSTDELSCNAAFLTRGGEFSTDGEKAFTQLEGSTITRNLRYIFLCSAQRGTDVSPSVNMVAFVTCRLAFTRTAFNYEHVPCSVFIFFFFFFFFFYFSTFRIARWHQRVANSFCQFERTFHTHGNDEINRPKWRFNYRESWVLHAARFLGTLVHEEPGQTSLIIY